ncbi:MAG: hypothetical protein AB7E60_09140 [Sphingobium sp.]
MIGRASILPVLFVLCAAAVSHANPAEKAQDTLPGHYYLRGMMEVGSELLLREDGGFRWAIAYGSMDQEAEGEWSLDGGVVTLGPRSAVAPVSFRAADILPWNDQADGMLADRVKEKAREAFRRSCPIAVLQDGQDHAVSDAVFAAPTTEDELVRSKEAADRARDRAQAVLDRLTARPGWQRDPALVAEIDRALGVHAEAEIRRVYQSDSARAAGMAVPPAPAPLALPPECEADEPDAAPVPPRAMLVAVFDPQRNRAARGFFVEVVYDRGPPVREALGARGAAFFPLPPGQRIVALSVMSSDGAVGKGGHRFPVTIGEPVVQLIHADLPRTEMPFERLQLKVEEDGRLRPLSGLKGYYVRSGTP